MGNLNPRQMAGVGHILNSGKHLLNLINEVLDIARIESGKVPVLHEPIQVQDIVVEMMDIVHPAIVKQQQTIEFIESPINQLFVIADRQRLRQVLLNLTNNAIKYNSAKGTVTIKTDLHTNVEDGVSFVRISIADTGWGISPDDQYKLFKPFERIGAEKTETEGTGLGLAVVKKLMDAMGGTVGVKSNLGTGSTFWIELPQSIAQGESVERTSNTPSESSKVAEKAGTILYIEDNPSNVELVSQILLAQRPEILLISNKSGRMAVPLALEYSPDLILLDLDLPDIHGLEVLGLLKRKESVNQIPVVIVSADATHQQLEKVMKAGAENYLTKPLDIPIFLSVVDEWIGKEK
jgi:CheY-like chemotaxis protein